MNSKRKTVNRKTGRVLKNKTFYGLGIEQNGTMVIGSVKEHPNHSVNSFLAHGGQESELKYMHVVEMRIVGKPMVKTVREINIV